MPVHWDEQEIPEARSKRQVNESNNGGDCCPRPEPRLGTADWRAFVREVHLLQKEKSMHLLNSTYLPKNIKR